MYVQRQKQGWPQDETVKRIVSRLTSKYNLVLWSPVDPTVSLICIYYSPYTMMKALGHFLNILHVIQNDTILW